jgi:microsomal dipeptidase-like Zn-dependent dipeptidase
LIDVQLYFDSRDPDQEWMWWSIRGQVRHKKRDEGLSEFWRALIAEMNRVGIIVDVSRTGYRTSTEAIEASNQPCIFSHANVYALFVHPRNIRMVKNGYEASAIAAILADNFLRVAEAVRQ